MGRRMDSEKHKSAIESADRSRRNYHNGILAHLRGLKRNCSETFPNELNVHIAEEKFFTDEELAEENRSYVGEWAYNTAVGEHLKSLLEKANKTVDENKESKE